MSFKLISVRALRGPNIWSQLTVLEAVLEKQTVDLLDVQNLTPYLEIKNSSGVTLGVFIKDISDFSLYAALVTFFQQCAEMPVSFWQISETSKKNSYKIIVAYSEEEVGRSAFHIAEDFFEALYHNHPYPLMEKLIALRDFARSERLGPSTQAIVDAVRARNIPVMRLNTHNLLQCGYGSRQTKIQAAETDRTSIVAENIAQHKELTKNLFRAVGVPTPRGRRVKSVEDAWEFACTVNMPIVIKPECGHQGKGVAVNLSTRAQIQAGFEAAEKIGPVMVETLIPGEDYRLLIVGDRLIAAARREPPAVIGDGKKTIAELVFEINQNPLRGEDHATVLSKLILDDIAIGVLQQQGLTIDSVLAVNQKAIIRANANLSTGGFAVDVTHSVHPEVAARAIDAAAVVGLNIAGIDVIAKDISRPLEEQDGGIVEVNAAPGLRMHLAPTSGAAQPVGDAIADLLFAPGEDGRIPIFAVTGTNGKTTTVRLIAHILREAGFYTGITCTEGVYANDECIDSGDCSGPKSTRLLLKNSCIDAAVLEVARGGIVREGLGFDLCQVAVVTNLGVGDHLGIGGIETLEDLARVKQTLVSSVLPQGTVVLNAADPLVAGMHKVCSGAEIIYFALHATEPCLRNHLAQGGKGVYTAEGNLIFSQGDEVIASIALHNVPLTHQGKIKFQVENVCAASAAIWAFGLNFSLLSQGLSNFKGDHLGTPGRFNVVHAKEAVIILDYGHNVSALESIIESLSEFDHTRRSVVYSVAGDRRDSDIVAQGLLLGNAFDQVIIYEDVNIMRGRASGDIFQKLTEGINQGVRVKEINTFYSEKEAAIYALEHVQPKDLLLLQVDDVFGIAELVQSILGEKVQ